MAYCSELDSTVVWTHRTLDTFEEDFFLALPVSPYICIGFTLLLDPTSSNQTQKVLLWLTLAVQEGIPLGVSCAHIHRPGTVPVCFLFSLKVLILLKTALTMLFRSLNHYCLCYLFLNVSFSTKLQKHSFHVLLYYPEVEKTQESLQIFKFGLFRDQLCWNEM